MVAAIASEYRQGRCSPISTTKLDVARPVTWNTGAIAASSAPGVRMPIIDIMLAAASRRRTEVHVGGAVTALLFLYPSAGDWRQMTKRPVCSACRNSTWCATPNSRLPGIRSNDEAVVGSAEGHYVDQAVDGMRPAHRTAMRVGALPRVPPTHHGVFRSADRAHGRGSLPWR